MPALPSRSSRRAPLPGGGRGTAALPGGSWARLPGGMLYEPPPAALFTGSGELSAIAAPVATAAFSGTGLLASVAAPAPSAGFAGEGEFIVPQNDAETLFSGAGVLSVSAVPVASAAFTGGGLLAATASPALTAGFTGSAALSASAVASATAGFTGAGTLTAPASSFKPSGMILGTASTTRIGTSYAQVPGTWVADTTTYPGSTMSGNELVVQTGGTGLTVQASVFLQNRSTFASSSVWLQLRVNNNTTPLATSADPTSMNQNTTGTATLQVTGVTLAAGDVVRIEARADATNRSTAEVNANTFVRIIQP